MEQTNLNRKILKRELEVVIACLVLEGKIFAYFDPQEQDVRFVTKEYFSLVDDSWKKLSFHQTVEYCNWDDEVLAEAEQLQKERQFKSEQPA